MPAVVNMDNVAPPPSARKAMGFMVPSPTDTHRLDPYAFPADECVPSPNSGTMNNCHGTKPTQLSLHPRTFLPPGNPLPHGSIHYERGTEFFQHQFSAPLHSPTHGSQPAQPAQHFTHPSSKLENDSAHLAVDQMHVLKNSYCQSLVSGMEQSPNQNGMFTSHTNLVLEKTRKKKKQKKILGEEIETITLKQELADPLLHSRPPVIDSSQSLSTANPCSVDFKPHSELVIEPTRFSVKSPASMMASSGDSSSSFQSTQASGSHISYFPTTTTVATFTNSLAALPQDRRHSVDSVDQSTSRPASRASTMSSSSVNSEGKLKEAAESVSLTKILEIIEREKMLGSSSPCKRRRTAKPQHIQEAEEEAKRYAAANAVQGVMNDALSTENLHPNQHNTKKSLQTDKTTGARNVSTGLLQEKSDSTSRTSSQVSSPNLPGLDISQLSNNSSLDVSERAQSQLSDHSGDGRVCDSMFSETAPPSGSDGSYLDQTRNPGTVSYVTADISVDFSHKLSGAISSRSLVTSLSRDDQKLSTFVAHTSHSSTDIATKQRTSYSSIEQSNVEHCGETLTLQEKGTSQTLQEKGTSQSVKMYEQSSNTHTSHIINESATCKSDYSKEAKESTPTGKLRYSHDLVLAGTASASTFPSTPNLGYPLNKSMFEGKTITEHRPSCTPMSTSTVENKIHLFSLHSKVRNFIHQSPSISPSSQRPNGSDSGMVPNTRPPLPAPDTLLNAQVQDLKPLFTSDLHCTGATSNMYKAGSQTADTISGNDLSLSQQPPGSYEPTSAAKKPQKKPSPNKPHLQSSLDNFVCTDIASPSASSVISKKPTKKHSPNKPVTPPSPVLSANSFSDSMASVGTLPPFNAFAGMKMDITHSSPVHLSDGAQPQCFSIMNMKTEMELPANIQRLSSPDQSMQTKIDSTDKSLIKGSKPQQPLQNSSTSGMKSFGDFIMSGNNCQTTYSIKQAVNPDIESGISNSGINGVRSVPGKCGNLISGGMDPYHACSEQHSNFKPSSSEVLHQRTVADNVFLNTKQDNTHSSVMKGMPLTEDKTVRSGVTPSLENSEVSSLTSIPVMPCNSTTQERTFSGNYLAHKKAANWSGMMSEKDSSRAVVMTDVDSRGMVTSLPQSNITSPSSASPNNRIVSVSSPIHNDSYSILGRTQPFCNKTPAANFPLAEVNREPLKVSYEKGKCSSQGNIGKCASQGNFPAVVNGWNGKPLIKSQALKQENISCGKPPAVSKHVNSAVGFSGFGRDSKEHASHSEAVEKKIKPSARFLMNGSLPDFSRTLPHMGGPATKAPPTPEPKLEPSFPPMSPEEELADRLRNNKIEPVPKCSCLGPNYEFNENVEGPYYTQLGKAKDMASLRQMMEKRTGLSGEAVRLEKVHYTGKEGRSQEGCPIAKWIIRRSGPEEKYLCVARKRPGHFCDATYIVVAIVAWEGVASSQADSLYSYMVSTLTKHGVETERRCGSNESKTCACQGVDLIRRGASYSFGCSWSMYFNGCKFARSHIARKFKLKDTNEEGKMEEHLQDLATKVGPLYNITAPDAYRNQVFFEEQASMCRLGKEKGKPFSGVTACVDFCAHSHKDFHNMQNGSTVVVTLTKHRGFSKPDDEQLHVLPLYVLDNTDEHGSVDGQMKKVEAGALEILHKYSQQVRMRAKPLKKARRGSKKASPAKASTGVNTAPSSPSRSAPGTPVSPGTPTPEKDTSFLYSQDSSQSLPDGSFSGNNTSAMHSQQRLDGSQSVFIDRENSANPDDMISQKFGPAEMYEKVWEYFYTHGRFPPPSYMDRWAAAQKQAMMNMRTHNSTDTGANVHGSNVNSPHQPPSHQYPFQAADFHQNCSSAGAQHPFPSGNQQCIPGHKIEAANPSDVDQEIIHLTHAGGGSSGVKPSNGRTPSRPPSVNVGEAGRPGSRHASPLDLLSEAATVLEAGRMENMSPSSPSHPHHFSSPVNAHSRPASRSSVPPSSPGECSLYPDMMHPNLPCPHSNPGVYNNHSGSLFMDSKPNCDGTSAPPSCNDNQPNCSTRSKPVMPTSGSFVTPTLGQGPDEPTFTMIDPSVVRCQWQDNLENFHDPGIGGVAIALSHGAVLFEVAKRELHATTALKNPNKYQPTRISLVFYQHKNLNYFHHGYYDYERKLATQRENRIKKLMEDGATAEEAEKAVKPGRKRKKKTEGVEEEEEKIDFAKTSAAQYKYMWDTTVRHGVSLTTDSIITRWIDPQPMVTGPYQRWV